MSLAFFSKSSSKAKVDDSSKPRQHRHTKSRSSSTSMMYDPSEPVRILNALSPNLPSTTQSILPYHPSRSQSIRHTVSISRLDPHYARSRTPRVSAPSAYHPRPQSPVEMIPERMSQSPVNSEVHGIVLQPSITRLMPLSRPSSVNVDQIMAKSYLLHATPFPHPPSVRTHRSQSSDPSYESSDNRQPSQESSIPMLGQTTKIPKLLSSHQPLSPPPRTLSVPTIPEDPRPASTSPILLSQRVSSFGDIPYMSLKGKERARAPVPMVFEQPHYALRRTSMFERTTDFYFNGKTLPEVDLLSPITLSTPFPSPMFESFSIDPDDDDDDDAASNSSSPVFESFPIGDDDESSSDDDGPIVFRSPTAVSDLDLSYHFDGLETGEETTCQELRVKVTKAEVIVEEDEENEEASEAVSSSSRDRTSEDEVRPSRQETKSPSPRHEHRRSHSPRTKEDRKPLWKEVSSPVERPFLDFTVSVQESFLAPPIIDDCGVVRKERNQGWSGEWNQPHIRDVIEKLRELR